MVNDRNKKKARSSGPKTFGMVRFVKHATSIFALIGMVGAGAIAVWSALPVENQKDYLKKFYFIFQKQPVFSVGASDERNCQGNNDFLDLERDTIEYISNKGLTVYSSTIKEELDRIPAKFSLAFSNVCDVDDSPKILKLTLFDENHNILSASTVDIKNNFLEIILMRTIDFSSYQQNTLIKTFLETLELPYQIRAKLGLEFPLKKYSSSAIFKYRAAQSAYRVGDIDSALNILERAITLDKNFAMGFWAQSEIYRELGDLIKAEKLLNLANTIDIDHPKIPLPEAKFISHVPNIKKGLSKLEYTQLYPDIFDFSRRKKKAYGEINYGEVKLDEHRAFHIWKFEKGKFNYAVRSRLSGFVSGSEVKHQGMIFVSVGGTFDFINGGDGKQSFLASGLLVEDGIEVNGNNGNWNGGGYLVMKDGEIDIIPQEKFNLQEHNSKGTYIIQSKILVVDPGGINGVYTDQKRLSARAAVCLDYDENPSFVVSTIPMSLIDFGNILSTKTQSGGLGCERAINLDGGPSVLAYYKSERYSEAFEIPSNWKVHNLIVVTPSEK
jgi:tetratricopeptide (TPR) repeat protein/uncharacterized protein YigE (DUF2233 family)